jgi:aryl-alcohol dehydrogenase-like predicted oxidoreductase
MCKESGNLSRRRFLGGALASGALALSEPAGAKQAKKTKPSIQRYRILGRTGFSVSDISMGGRIENANVVRYAYDHGVNFFDVAETYGNGDAERKLGEAMKYLDRKKIFVVTKLVIKPEDTKKTILDRFGKCRERMQTEYADALYMHSVTDVRDLNNKAFHAAIKTLKASGQVKHAGVSSHGPRGKGDSMQKVLVAAAEDGRFDVMLLVYSFLNSAEGAKILEACAKNKVGTSLMKVKPGVISVDPFDPDKPSEEYAKMLERLAKHGFERQKAIEYIRNWLKEEESKIDKTKPFVKKHGIKSDKELDRLSVKWVLKNKNVHTACIAMAGFDDVDEFLALSGAELAAADETLLRDWALAYGHGYCRHGCSTCVSACPSQMPVSTIMRYASYFAKQGREKYAMQKYADLPASVASCFGCDAPCATACPYGVSVPAQLLKADGLLSWA